MHSSRFGHLRNNERVVAELIRKNHQLVALSDDNSGLKSIVCLQHGNHNCLGGESLVSFGGLLCKHDISGNRPHEVAAAHEILDRHISELPDKTGFRRYPGDLRLEELLRVLYPAHALLVGNVVVLFHFGKRGLQLLESLFIDIQTVGNLLVGQPLFACVVKHEQY